MQHWGKDSLHLEDRRLLSGKQAGGWFRLEKMAWKAYRRGPTSFSVYTEISRFYKAKPK